MANQEHVDLLKQGAEQWNAWREQNQGIKPDLSSADLSSADLSHADLSSATLRDADLSGADLIGADLSRADLISADLVGANLNRADLSRADLDGADLRSADLNGADLNGADLSYADLSGATLSGVDLSGATLNDTSLGGIDLRTTKGLTEIRHDGPSHIDLHTIQLPQGRSAHHFLRGVGIPDPWIAFWRVKRMHPIQYHSLFISYSSKDQTLAQRLHADLQDHGVRCWFAPEDLKIGDRFHSRIDEAIHLQDKLLLLLSESAIQSDWVEIEVRAALEKEQRQHRDVLFPVRLDSSVMETSQAWAAMLRRSRHIGDFTNWTDPQTYRIAFKRMLADLKKTNERQDQEMKQ